MPKLSDWSYPAKFFFWWAFGFFVGLTFATMVDAKDVLKTPPSVEVASGPDPDTAG